jgi:ATP-dependent DNA helicase RecG
VRSQVINRRELSSEDALTLVRRDEDHFFDHKALQIGGAKIQKIAVAFANADGGEILVGIADSSDEPDPQKRWQGSGKIEQFNFALQALNDVRPSLNIQYEFLESRTFPGFVLRVAVEKSPDVHYTSDGKVYIRLGAQSLPIATPDRIQELAFAKGTTSFEDQVAAETKPEDITESAQIANFLAEYSPKTDPLELVVMQNLVDRNTWQPRVAGILLFATSPSALLPRKCAIKIVRYETKEDDPERDYLGETITIEGPLYQQINDAITAVARIMSQISIWTATGLKTVQYPPEAIWEIVVNAVIHRDYSISDDVQVLIFDNRIEVISPGRLPSFVTAENILDTRYSRNPKIVRTLNRYRNAPNKDLGEGLNTAFEKMKEFRLQPPRIEQNGNYVKVTIPHVPLARPTELILEFLSSHDRITNHQCRDLTGIKSENVVKREFYKLRDQGLLEMVQGPAWRLSDTGRQHVQASRTSVPSETVVDSAQSKQIGLTFE